MTQYIAFLRGINLGKRRVKMEELRHLFEKMKFSNVATFIASGNVIFESGFKNPKEVEAVIETKLARALGYEVDTFVRTRAEVAALAVAKPFKAVDMASSTNTMNVGFFKQPLDPDLARKFTAIRTDVDEFCVAGREYFWLCRIKMSESQVWTLPQVRALKFPTSSMRNLRTVRNLADQFPATR
jgi:uncharacterized protein (DUF1697 family)